MNYVQFISVLISLSLSLYIYIIYMLFDLRTVAYRRPCDACLHIGISCTKFKIIQLVVHVWLPNRANLACYDCTMCTIPYILYSYIYVARCCWCCFLISIRISKN